MLRGLLCRASVTAALVTAAVASPTGAGATPVAHVVARPAVTSADLPRLTRELAQVTAQAQQLSADLDRAAAQDGGLRVAYARLEDARYAAQTALDQRAHDVWTASAAAPDPFADLGLSLASPGLRHVVHAGERASLTVSKDLVDAVTTQSAQVAALQRQADAFRTRLMGRAQQVLVAQDRARDLYAQAKALADAEHDAAVQAELERQRAALDAVSTTVTLALTPAQSRRSQAALADQAPVVALLERSGSAIPEGYTRSGQVFGGTASWYGPGFVGRPTASGAPYDPERLTCANKELPLGTVIHVSANGREVNCLVNDRGPYVGDRVLDMSRAGSRALGYSGLAQVTVEVLLPTG